MIELRILLDDIDYDALAELLLPLAAQTLVEKGGLWAMLGRNQEGMTGVARQLLKTMSQEKRDDFLLQLLQEKKSVLLDKANEKAAEREVGIRILDMSAAKIPK